MMRRNIPAVQQWTKAALELVKSEDHLYCENKFHSNATGFQFTKILYLWKHDPSD